MPSDEQTKRVTSAEWVANTAALMRDHDLVEIVDDNGAVRAVYTCPKAPAFDCDECEAKDAAIATLTAERDAARTVAERWEHGTGPLCPRSERTAALARVEALTAERDALERRTRMLVEVNAALGRLYASKSEERDAAVRERDLALRKAALMATELTEANDLVLAVRAKLRVATAERDDVWLWEDSGSDNPASLSCPVVMSAETLRTILRERDEAQRVFAGTAGAAKGVEQAWARLAAAGARLAAAEAVVDAARSVKCIDCEGTGVIHTTSKSHADVFDDEREDPCTACAPLRAAFSAYASATATDCPAQLADDDPECPYDGGACPAHQTPPETSTVGPTLVHCRYCNKTHAPMPGDTPCSPGAWVIEGTGQPWPEPSAEEKK